MKKETVFILLISFVILGLIFAACNFPGLQPTQDQFATAAAQTIDARLTQALVDTPVIIQETLTPQPTSGFPPTNTVQPSPSASPTEACVDKASLEKDVTIPDYTRMDPGQSFEKIWRLKNTGTCTWTTAYSLVFDSENIMGASPSKQLTGTVPPGGTIDMAITFIAPSVNGEHRSLWKLRNDKGLIFGIGTEGNKPFWVWIIVGPTPTPKPVVVYSLIDFYCTANWYSGAGALPCPGADGDIKGFVLKVNNPKFENGVTDDEPVLFTHPQWVNDGIISGRFPAFDVKAGDHFMTVIGCLYKSGGSACNVRFQVTYRADGGPVQILDQWDESYDGNIRKIDIDLGVKGLAGKSIEFTLVVMANGISDQDWAFWLLPRIEGPPR